MSVVDPSELVEERLREELAPLRELLANTVDSRERRLIGREISRREREIRKALSGNSTAW